MKVFLQKAVGVLRGKNPVIRVVQALNKSPIRFFSKSLAISCSPVVYKTRKSAIQQVTLTEKEKSIVDSLDAYGYAELSGLLSDDNLKALSDYCLDKMRRSEEIRKREVLKSKDIWIMLSDEDIADKNLTAENPLVNFALQAPVLKIVSAYLKQVPFIEYVALTLSRFSPGPLKSSQLWHLDYDNTSMVKMFVYLTDVSDVASGPFTFFDAVASKNVKNSFITRHLPDQEVFNYVDEKMQTQMIRPKLSCFMVDTTRCYHMGSRLHEGHERLMYTALYTGLPPIYPWAGKEKYQLTAGLNPLQKLALKVKPE